jgi:large subunit ribosomal protein L19
MIAVRRQGIDTSFRLRAVIQRLGIEQVFKLYNPNIKVIRVIHRGALRGRWYRQAKLYYMREPGKRNMLGGVEAVVKKSRRREAAARAERRKLQAESAAPAKK